MNIDTKNKILEVIAGKGKAIGISAEKIIEETNLGRKTVKNYLTDMQRVGIIDFRHRGSPSKIYYIREKEKEI